MNFKLIFIWPSFYSPLPLGPCPPREGRVGKVSSCESDLRSGFCFPSTFRGGTGAVPQRGTAPGDPSSRNPKSCPSRALGGGRGAEEGGGRRRRSRRRKDTMKFGVTRDQRGAISHFNRFSRSYSSPVVRRTLQHWIVLQLI